MTNKNYNQTLSEICLHLDNGNYKTAAKLSALLPGVTKNQAAIRTKLLILSFLEDKQAIKKFLDKVYLMDY